MCIIGSPRTFTKTADNVLTTLAEASSCIDHFFLIRTNHMAEKNTKGGSYATPVLNDFEAAVRRFAPVAVRYSNTTFASNPECVLEQRAMSNWDTSVTKQPAFERVWETMVGFKECFQLVRDHEVRRGGLYGSVVRLRTDMVFFGALKPSVLRPVVTTLPRGKMAGSANDHLAFLPRDAAPTYFEMSDRYVHCKGVMPLPKLTALSEFIHMEFSMATLPWRNTSIDYTLVRSAGTDCSRAGIGDNIYWTTTWMAAECARCTTFVRQHQLPRPDRPCKLSI